MGLGKTYSTKYLLDSNNNTGVAGQVLSTTSTGIDWVDANTVPGSGLWLANGNDIYNSNSGNVGVGVITPANLLSAYNTDSTLLSSKTPTGAAENGTGGGNRGFNDSFTNATRYRSCYNRTGNKQPRRN